MKTSRSPLLLSFANLLLLLFLSANSSQDTFEKITVKEFELVDQNGKRRVSIKVEPEGDVVVFRMMDNGGTIRVKMGADEKGSGLVLLDNDTNPGVHALANDKGTTLTLTGKDGKKREY